MDIKGKLIIIGGAVDKGSFTETDLDTNVANNLNFFETGILKRILQESKHGLEVIIPEATDRELVHNIIYNELCLGLIRDSARQTYREVIRRLIDRGAQGVILGCTEISMLIAPSDSPIPLFDTTSLHAQSAVEFALMR